MLLPIKEYKLHLTWFWFLSDLLSVDGLGRTKLYKAAYDTQLTETRKMIKSAKELGILPELINKADNYGQTPLYNASNYGHLRSVKLLLNNGAEIDKAKFDGATPLMGASLKGHLDVVDVLLRHNANVHLKDTNGDTALSIAKQQGNTIIAETLEKAGAKWSVSYLHTINDNVTRHQ